MPNTKAKASTQDHLDIEDITDDLVLLKTGWVALVMSTTAVNFDILSEAEQDATIYAYGALLNSLSFPVQILIRSKRADITSYFHKLEEAEASQPNPDLKRQIQGYEDFIKSTVQQKTVLDKRFYLIITFSPVELGIKVIKAQALAKSKKAQLIADAKITLMPKRDHLIKQTARLGLSSRQLTTQELIELFYDIYNPAPSGTQHVLLDPASYTVPLVEPALEVPSPAPSGAPPSPTPSGPVAQTPQLDDPRLPPVPSLRPIPIPTSQPINPPGVSSRPIDSQHGPISQNQKPQNQDETLKNLQATTAQIKQMIGANQPTQNDQGTNPIGNLTIKQSNN